MNRKVLVALIVGLLAIAVAAVFVVLPADRSSAEVKVRSDSDRTAAVVAVAEAEGVPARSLSAPFWNPTSESEAVVQVSRAVSEGLAMHVTVVWDADRGISHATTMQIGLAK